MQGAGIREVGLELQDVPGVGGAEGVDRLRVVAHDGDAGVVCTQKLQQLDLQGVHVLVLVDEDVVVQSAQAAAHQVVAQRLPPVQQQIVEIQQAEPALAGDVRLAHRTDGFHQITGPRSDRGHDLADRSARVDRARVDVQQGRLAGDPAAVGQILENLVAHHVHHIGGICGVEHGESLGQPESGGVLAQRAVCHRVEGAAGDPSGLAPGARQAGMAAFDHLASGAAGEREQQHPFGGDPVGDDPGHARAQGRGLAGARACQHPQRPAVELGDGTLFVVEALK